MKEIQTSQKSQRLLPLLAWKTLSLVLLMILGIMGGQQTLAQDNPSVKTTTTKGKVTDESGQVLPCVSAGLTATTSVTLN